jgi:anti-sigma-K factor RskA
MRGRGTGLHALVGAYVMDAVSAADRAAFERHLPDCEQCREDVRGLREATARLASAAAIRPRAGLRDQTLLAATRIRQLPPVLAGQDRERQRSPAGRRRGLSWPGWARLGWPATGGRWTWLARTAVVAAVVLACTAVAFGLNMNQMQNRLSAAQQRDSSIAAIMSAHDAVTLTAHVSSGGTATVVMSHRARALVFIASGLTALPPAKSYELWLMGPSGATPAGMLPSGRRGMMVVNRLQAGDQLGLTIEPAGGAPRPTTPPVIMMGLGS